MSTRRTHKPASDLAQVGWNWKETGLIAGLILIFFLVICLSSASTAKGVALVAAICAIAALVYRHKQFAARLSIPFLALSLWVIMNGISTLYAVSGKFALRAFVVLLISFCCVILLLAFAKGEHGMLGRNFATVLEGTAAVAGLVSIDLLSTHLISTPVLGLLGLFTQDYAYLTPVEVGIRMNSIFTNPNVFAGCMGIGVFLSLGLAGTSRQAGHRRFHLVCLYINALSFLLAFSMGGSGTIAVGFLIYLLLERRQSRGSALVLMVETLILVGAGGVLVSATSLVEWTGFQPVPLVCVVVGAALLCVADQFVGQRLGKALEGRTRVVPILIGAVVALLVVFAVVAMQMTGPASLNAGETLRRSAYPEPGSYTLSVTADGPVNVILESQNKEDTMMHTSTVIYSGPADGAAVEVPEDSIVVYANFSADAPVTLERVALEGSGGAVEFPLGYQLLPEFIANRMQGLWANQNAIQRVVFFEDGMKLFQRSPVIGLGMGAYENGIVSVQSFYYETKYAHNHYIESLVETGVVGLILFVGVLVTALIAVIKSRRKLEEESNPLTAALGGALVFMAGHAAVEVVFSYYAYLPLAFGVFGLIALCCGQTMPLSFVKEGVRKGVTWVLAVLILAYTVLLGCNVYAKSLVDREQSFASLESAITLDRFEWADYMLSYVLSYMQMEAPSQEIQDNAAIYASKLQEVDSNTIPLYLAQYYFEQQDADQAFAMLDKYTDYVAADPDTWEQAFHVIIQYYQDDPVYLEGVTALYQKMLAWNAEHMGTLTLSESTMGWLEQFGIA
ncbi:O-antigen ligase family protein [Pseudoflavonifractor phocaeensis]|uniref:O-antigen ligase family protein n=1 Tax=Pseudoflavonifractor phocaeensis TaxID=1870988 RepID=UPI00195C18CB|nr:O-antigen ligase family protein [Pseudoflavonifractor phocaeensis]MBM6721501.1 O-antigen ligase family protein [Pseudoflavonifractor phocaeensis]